MGDPGKQELYALREYNDNGDITKEIKMELIYHNNGDISVTVLPVRYGHQDVILHSKERIPAALADKFIKSIIERDGVLLQ